jgi:IclR family pca regulon transcriptional regulator
MQRLGNPDDKEFLTTLAKGLAVLGAFGQQRPTDRRRHRRLGR